MKTPTFLSESGASTSSKMKKGGGLFKELAKIKARVTTVFCPPDKEFRFSILCPEKETATSIKKKDF